MKHTSQLLGACLLGGLMLVVLWGGLTGPTGASSDVTLSADAGAVVIDEIAWMGTPADYNDEWIELVNTTGRDIDLTDWSLVAADGSPNVPLAGVIPAHGTFLLERTDDSAIDDLPADQFYAGALGNDPGETLTLYDATGQVVDVVNGDGGPWPAGANPAGDPAARATMERIDPLAPGDDANWATHDGAPRNGHDAAGHPINGTPRCRNTAAAPAADLVVAQAGPSTVLPGQTVTYTIRVHNPGNLAAAGAVVTDALPPGVAFLTQTAPFTFSQPTSRTLVWQAGTLPISTTPSLITAVVRLPLDLSGPIVNDVMATSSVTEAAVGNNAAAFTITLPSSVPALSIVKSGPAWIEAGAVFTYCIALSNTGQVTATGVVVTDALPPGLHVVGQTSPFTFALPTSATLVWRVGDLPPGPTAEIVLIVQAAAGLTGSVVNAVTTTDGVGRVAVAAWASAVAPWVRLYALHPTALYSGDEAVALINLGTAPASVGGWRVGDGGSLYAVLPST
ncbi:MAG: DUF11 domain-containing protein, partial [Anaerolineae bacterium]|nr:DUF11 domain-containing protein [Anaerolineae bacterium]